MTDKYVMKTRDEFLSNAMEREHLPSVLLIDCWSFKLKYLRLRRAIAVLSEELEWTSSIPDDVWLTVINSNQTRKLAYP